MLVRPYEITLGERLKEAAPLIQVLIGPRQVGKTTAVLNLQKQWGEKKFLYFAADESLVHSAEWLREKWSAAKQSGPGTILAIDEIQKIENWSEVIKGLYDREVAHQKPADRLKVVLLGSSSLEVQKGLKESLTGRFELLRAYHWDACESQETFGLDLGRFLSYGGYPASYQFIEDYPRWYTYVKESIVETVIGKDLLSIRSVRNPVLFRHVFELLCRYPAQEISYTKLLGQLQEKGNVEIVKHYLSLYEGAFLFRALEKYSTNPLKKKSSSPKILPLCPAFYAMTIGPDASTNPIERGRLLELSVGSILDRLPGELYYWREGVNEVDFVYVFGKAVYGIEVKSGKRRGMRGLETFRSRFSGAKTVMIHEENFLDFTRSPENFLKKAAI